MRPERQPSMCADIASPHLTVRLSAESGLRITRLSQTGCDTNILGQFPDVQWETPWGPYRFVGGHRLWVAPERQPDVCEPELEPVVEIEAPDRARLTHRRPSPSGLVKTLEIELAADAPAASVRHRVENHGARAVWCALWALTMVELGGVVLVPHDVESSGGSSYTPNRLLVGWPYTDFTDPRLTLASDHLAWRAIPGPAWKLGTLSRHGQIAYARGGVMLQKRFVPEIGAEHADDGCNVELYSNDRFAEIETLGSLVCLEPGAATDHVEQWRVHTIPDAIEADINALLGELQEGTVK